MMRTLCLVCLLLLSGGVRGDELMASVDRQQIAEGDTVELTLELGGLALSGQPDLSPLLPLFPPRSPMRSSMRPAYACGPCRSRRQR